MTEPWAIVTTVLDAPAEVRDGLARELGQRGDLSQRTVLIATCHRVELYGFGERPAVAARVLAGSEAVRRVLRIAAGLESASLGEDEVLHQVRQALAAARSAGLDDGRLIRLVETAIAAGRRARAGGKPRARSMEARAVDWLAARTPMERVLVVGTGHVGSRLAAEASSRGAQVTLATRRPRRGQLDLAQAAAAADGHDAVAVAISGPWPVAGAGLPAVADLSAPGALPEPARAALGADHLGIDDLFALREEDPVYAARATALVERAAGEYMAWLESRKEATA